MTTTASHIVQFYGGGSEGRAIRDVSAFLAEGLARAQLCVVAATTEHRQAFLQELHARHVDIETAVAQASLVLLDANALAESLLDGGVPSARLFDEQIAARIRAGSAGKKAGTRIYGEIVGVYTSQGRSDLAAQLEEIWNDFLREHNATLYCGYPIDVFEPAFSESDVHSIMCWHSLALSAVDAEKAIDALYAALEEVLGERAGRVRELMYVAPKPGWASLPAFEGCVLWLRRNLRRYADDIMRSTESRLRSA